MHYRGPFINLRLYDDFLVIGGLGTIVLTYDEIERVEVNKWLGAVADGVRIVHRKSGAPGKIVIGTASPERLKEMIEAQLPPMWM